MKKFKMNFLYFLRSPDLKMVLYFSFNCIEPVADLRVIYDMECHQCGAPCQMHWEVCNCGSRSIDITLIDVVYRQTNMTVNFISTHNVDEICSQVRKGCDIKNLQLPLNEQFKLYFRISFHYLNTDRDGNYVKNQAVVHIVVDIEPNPVMFIDGNIVVRATRPLQLASSR